MDAAALRHALAAFLGADRFRKFVDHLRRAGRLRFWQEGVWTRFTAEHPEFAVTFHDLQAALRICELHGCDLQPGTARSFQGCRDHTTRYIRIRSQRFPHAAPEPVSIEGAPLGEREVPIWYCPECRVAEAAWKDQLSPAVTIEDVLCRKESFPYIGVPVDDFLCALKVLAAHNGVADKRVMGCRFYSDSHLLVKTGEQLGGCSGGGNHVLLRKEANEWVVAEVTRWLS